jgi:aromatic ring-cleaving dioxygenase
MKTTKALICYHAHIYFKPEQVDIAVSLRQEIGRTFKVDIGNIHTKPIGPHTSGMFQIIFMKEQFASFVPWLMFNRQNLNVLIHPDTGNHLKDHTEYALWLGQSQAINTSIFNRL